MNLELKNITGKIIAFILGLKRYLVFIFILVVLVVYGYLVFHINTLSSQVPDEDAVTERLKAVQRPRIDEDAVTKIENLEDQNIQVKTIFQEARDNPFVE